MNHKKRGLLLLIAILLSIVVHYVPLENDSLTGSAVLSPQIGLEQPNETQLPVPTTTAIPLTTNETVELEEQPLIQETPTPSQDPSIQASCSSWPCSCGDSITTNITMNSSLTSCSGTALSIGASDITLDCAGYTLGGSSSISFSSVYISSKSNVTIKNCNLDGSGRGINTANVDEAIFQNITINSTSYGIYGSNLDDTNITGITQSDSNNPLPNFGYGAYFTGTSTANRIINSSFSSNYNNGIFFDFGSHADIINSTIQHTENSGAVYTTSGFSSREVSGNTIYNNSGYGLYLRQITYSTISGNNITNNSGVGLNDSFFGDENLIINNIFSGNQEGALSLLGTDDYNITNNTFINNLGTTIVMDDTTVSNSFNANFTLNNITTNHFAFFLHPDASPQLKHADTSNLINNRPFYYLNSENHTTISEVQDPSNVFIIQSTNVTLENLNLSNGAPALYIYQSHNINVTNTTLQDSLNGMQVELLGSNIFSQINATNNNQSGIYFVNTTNNTLQASSLTNNSNIALYFDDSNNNSVSDTNATNNTYNFHIIASSTTNFNNTFANVFLSEAPLAYHVNQDSLSITNQNLGALYLINSNSASISNAAISNAYYAIYLNAVNHTLITQLNSSNHLYGAYLSASTNITLQELNFSRSSNSDGYGVYLQDSNSTNISHSFFDNHYYSIYLNTNGATIDNTTITNNYNGVFQGAIYIIQSNGHNITNNYLTGTSSNKPYLINTNAGDQANNMLIFNNTLEHAQNCLALGSSSSNNNVSDNIFTNCVTAIGSGTGSDFISNLFQNSSTGISSTSSSNFTSNIFLNNTYAVTSLGSSNSFKNNNFTLNQQALSLASTTTGNNNTYFNNSLAILFTSSNGDTDALLANETILYSDSAFYAAGVDLGENPFPDPSSNLTIKDSTLSNNILDVNISDSAGGDTTTFTNVTFNQSNFDVGALHSHFVKWYVDVNVSNQTGEPIENVNVSSYLSNGSLENQIFTSTNGIARLTITELYKSNGISYIPTPTTITAQKGNYTTNSTIINLRNQTYMAINLTLQKAGCGDTISADYYFGTNLDCTGDGLAIGKSHITLYGENFRLRGPGSNIGLIAQNITNITINNLNITNFTRALDFYNTNDSTLSLLEIYNNSIGLVFNRSDNNNLQASIIANNTVQPALLENDGETINNFINVSTNITNVDVQSTATLKVKKIVVLNATFGDDLPLLQANITAYLNDSTTKDASALTSSQGIATLYPTELIKNSTGTYYQTPHNISLVFTTTDETVRNETSINLTQTGNTNVNFKVTLNCTVPYNNMVVKEDTTLCPGSFSVSDITLSDVDWSFNPITLTCDRTTLLGTDRQSSKGIRADGENVKVAVTGCNFSGYQTAIHFTALAALPSFEIENSTFNDCSLTSGNDAQDRCVIIQTTSDGTIGNSTFTDAGIHLLGGSNHELHNLVIQDNLRAGLLIDGVQGLNLTNSTFDDNSKAIRYYAGNNTFIYHNTFTDSGNYHIQYSPSLAYQNYLNQSINSTHSQGNSWDDYCNKGLDTNGDSYADNESSSGAGDYPYDLNTSSKIIGPLTDHHPLVQECITEVQVGSPSSSGGSSSSAAAGGGGDIVGGTDNDNNNEQAAQQAQAPQGNGQEASPEEIKQLIEDGKLKIDVDIVEEKQEQPELKSENLGKSKTKQAQYHRKTTVLTTFTSNTDKVIRLKPNVHLEIGSKTQLLEQLRAKLPEDQATRIAQRVSLLNRENVQPIFVSRVASPLSGALTAAQSISGIIRTGQQVEATLLQDTLSEATEVVIQPGQTLKQEIPIEQGLSANSRPLDVSFTSSGEEVTRRNFNLNPVPIGATLDVDTTNHLLDLYLVIPKNESSSEVHSYYLEMMILNDQGMLYNELFGPFQAPLNQGFVFAQQFEYDPARYSGLNTLVTNVYHSGELIASHGIDTDLKGTSTILKTLSAQALIAPLAFLLFSIILVIWTINWRRKQL